MSRTLSAILPQVILNGFAAALAYEVVPLYGMMVSGLFDQVAAALALAQVVA